MQLIIDSDTTLHYHGNYCQGSLEYSWFLPQALFILKDMCFAGYVLPFVKVSVPDRREYTYYKDTSGLYAFPKEGSLKERLDECFMGKEPYDTDKPVSILEVKSCDPDFEEIMNVYSNLINTGVYDSRKMFMDGPLADQINENICDFYRGLVNCALGRNLVVMLDGHLQEKYLEEAKKDIGKSLFLPHFIYLNTPRISSSDTSLS